jgi:hypothetical protein
MHRQSENEVEVVVGGNPIVPLDAAGKAPMNDHVLAFGPSVGSDRSHRASTRARAVARRVGVDVARVKTERTVISMVSSTNRGTNHRAAAAAAELLGTAEASPPGGSIAVRIGQCRPLFMSSFVRAIEVRAGAFGRRVR